METRATLQRGATTAFLALAFYLFFLEAAAAKNLVFVAPGSHRELVARFRSRLGI